MTSSSDRPERPSRGRATLGGDLPDPTASNARPSTGPARAVDLDRLRASAALAVAAETAPPTAPTPSPEPMPVPAAAAEAPTGTPGWLKVALPIGVAAALLTIGVTTLTGGADDVAEPPRTSASPAPAPTTAAPTTAVPTTAVPTTAVPTTAAPTTAAPTTAAPTTAAPAAPDPSAPPAHKATYRGGKLYLEGRITSEAEGQKYVEKAAAVLGADNVVNNYVVDPSVPPSTDGTVYVDEPFLFDTGSSELNPQYTGVLGLGVAALKLNPNARMVVTGYTDNRGDPAKNQELSLARANAVVDYMVTSGGIDRSRFDAIGAGDQNPVGDNATEAGRQLNRRIDVKLVNLLG